MDKNELMKEKYKDKRLLFFDGSQVALLAIKKAKEWGIETIVANYYPKEKNPGKMIADESYDMDFSDTDKMAQFILDKNIDGVMAGWTDSHLVKYAQICQKSSLPCYGTPELFRLFSHKKEYKELLLSYNIPVVEGYELNDINSEEELKSIEYPVLVKPSDGSGSRGIRVCRNLEELKAGYCYAKEYSECGDVIVERYIEGDEIVAFWFIQSGKPYLTALGNWHKKKYYSDVNAMGIGYSFPSKYIYDYEAKIAPKIKKLIENVGVENGLMFFQSFVENNVIKVYDIGFRLTGTLDFLITNKICNYNAMERMIEFALSGVEGDDVTELVDPHYRGKYGWNVSVLVKPGEIDKIIGLDQVRKSSGVIDAVLNHQEGDIISEAEKGNLSQVVLRVLGASGTKEEILRDMKHIYEIFNVLDKEGNSLILSDVSDVNYVEYVM